MSQVILNTDGKRALWSNRAKAVRIVDMVLEKGTEYEDDRTIFGEFRVYFDTETWDTYEDGLIYTDEGFMRELRAFFNAHGLPGKDISYSEQGMQGDDYVSCDVGGKFLKSWGEKFGINWDALVRKQEADFKARWG